MSFALVAVALFVGLGILIVGIRLLRVVTRLAFRLVLGCALFAIVASMAAATAAWVTLR